LQAVVAVRLIMAQAARAVEHPALLVLSQLVQIQVVVRNPLEALVGCGLHIQELQGVLSRVEIPAAMMVAVVVVAIMVVAVVSQMDRVVAVLAL